MPLIYGMTHWTKAGLQIKKGASNSRPPQVSFQLAAVSSTTQRGDFRLLLWGACDFLQEFVEFFRLNLERLFLHLDLGLNDR